MVNIFRNISWNSPIECASSNRDINISKSIENSGDDHFHVFNGSRRCFVPSSIGSIQRVVNLHFCEDTRQISRLLWSTPMELDGIPYILWI